MASFYVKGEGACLAPKRVQNTSGKSDRVSCRPAQPPICPKCRSPRTWKDGLRRTDAGVIQRYVCRNCGYRFSDPSLKDKKTKRHTLARQVCAEEDKAINLVKVETRQKQATGATETTDTATVKGKIIEYLWWMKKQGYAEDTIRLYVEVLEATVRRGGDLSDPESIKKVIACQETWGPARKNNAVKAYSACLKMHHLAWKKPKYKVFEKLPFIPLENEIDGLIACCSQQMSTFLQVLKESAARRGEAFNLRWADIDLAKNTLRITPEKGSSPRIVRISMKLARMLNNLHRTGESDKVWVYKNKFYLDEQFRRQRKRIARKLANPRILRIHFHTLRHWKATMLCHQKNGNIYVMRFLGHKNIKNTLRYIHLWKVLYPNTDEAFTCEVAKNISEATKLIEAGFEYVTEMDDHKLFRKRKTSLLGSSSIQMGSSASMV